MSAILALDAAWTDTGSSGVALLSTVDGMWQCLALAPGYGAFVASANGIEVDWRARQAGSPPDPHSLLSACRRLLGGRNPDLVTIDMPVATRPIDGRREADNLVSEAFGGAGCGTHTPNRDRPGALGAALSAGLVEAGFPLATKSTIAPAVPRLVEVYPHPALLSLLEGNYRVMYKCAKARKYWPGVSVAARAQKLLAEYANILARLRLYIRQIPDFLPTPEQVSTVALLKRFEDAVDALVCGWVGMRYLSGQIECYGDDTAAIWTPSRAQR